MENKQLIIGIQNSGKTHFAGQIYGRLLEGKSTLSLRNQPDDLTIFEEILRALADGRSSGHTPKEFNKSLVLSVRDEEDILYDLVYPDYAGEQVSDIIFERKLNKIWEKHILTSDSWLLLIRVDEIEKIEDITTRLYDRIDNPKNLPVETAIDKYQAPFFVELLQMFLHVRSTSSKNLSKTPPLKIVCSCWDKLYEQDLMPSDFVKLRLPLLYYFIESTWDSNTYSFWGLSSTGKDLKPNISDEDYLDLGPEEFGYVIQPNGEKSNDLTLLIYAQA